MKMIYMKKYGIRKKTFFTESNFRLFDSNDFRIKSNANKTYFTQIYKITKNFLTKNNMIKLRDFGISKSFLTL